jgi:hypothetical protein
MDSSAPSILHLPVELLLKILSFTVPSIKPEGGMSSPETLSQSPFHAVRSTCRDFRQLVNELPFWLDDDFNIAEIDHDFPTEERSQESYQRSDSDGIYEDSIQEFGEDTSRLKVLLSDRHLRQCLRRKTSWFCDSLDVLQTLQRYMPSFGNRVRQLKFINEPPECDDDDGTGAYIEYLMSRDDILNHIWGIFPILTVLQLEGTTVHLKFLPRSLKKLILAAPLCENCDCKNHLPNLEQLLFLYHNFRSPIEFKKMLPLNSKATLEELQLAFPIACPPSRDVIEDFPLLHQFENLRILRIKTSLLRLTDMNTLVDVYQNLSRCPFQLKTFESNSPKPRPIVVNALVDLLNSPVLHNLVRLRISFASYTEAIGPFEIQIEEKHTYQPLIIAISSLPSLEHLQLFFFPLHVDWIPHFRNSPCLKFVHWVYRSFHPIEAVGEYDFGELEDSLWDVVSRAGGEIPRSGVRIQSFEKRLG